jgi:hypothetical protein
VARAIIYPHKLAALQHAVAARALDDEEVYGATKAERGQAPAEVPESADDWAARLAKHIPAEVLPPFLLVTSLTDLSNLAQWIFLVFFAAAAVLVDRRNNLRLQPPALRPTGWIYSLFAFVAFVAWVLGTSSPTRDLIGCSAGLGTAIMVAVAWALGELDKGLAARLDR